MNSITGKEIRQECMNFPDSFNDNVDFNRKRKARMNVVKSVLKKHNITNAEHQDINVLLRKITKIIHYAKITINVTGKKDDGFKKLLKETNKLTSTNNRIQKTKIKSIIKGTTNSSSNVTTSKCSFKNFYDDDFNKQSIQQLNNGRNRQNEEESSNGRNHQNEEESSNGTISQIVVESSNEVIPESIEKTHQNVEESTNGKIHQNGQESTNFIQEKLAITNLIHKLIPDECNKCKRKIKDLEDRCERAENEYKKLKLQIKNFVIANIKSTEDFLKEINNCDSDRKLLLHNKSISLSSNTDILNKRNAAGQTAIELAQGLECKEIYEFLNTLNNDVDRMMSIKEEDISFSSTDDDKDNESAIDSISSITIKEEFADVMYDATPTTSD